MDATKIPATTYIFVSLSFGVARSRLWCQIHSSLFWSEMGFWFTNVGVGSNFTSDRELS